MKRNKKIYWIDVNDIQEVALQNLNRELDNGELNKVINKMGDYINWADGISYAINVLHLKEEEIKA